MWIGQVPNSRKQNKKKKSRTPSKAGFYVNCWAIAFPLHISFPGTILQSWKEMNKEVLGKRE